MLWTAIGRTLFPVPDMKMVAKTMRKNTTGNGKRYAPLWHGLVTASTTYSGLATEAFQND